MSRWKRTGLSLTCLGLTEIVASIVFTFGSPLQEHWWTTIIAWLWVISVFAFPGWLLSLPFLLSIQATSKLRLWLMGIIGTMIGPCVIGAIDLLSWISNRSAGAELDGASSALPLLSHFQQPSST